ncbi:hypothetical protein HPP92_023461 [Vanilla planifolia]|uniref:Stress-response A/B barrel domain-containing protein n=1 Tax=Vanilla planifolia TaxID=51239 RepID=A0A835UCV4_VANPL|nr:hypothetical protein HPP92_023461 [Vanilla planifolia]
MAPVSVVEHLVLFKVRESTDPLKIDAMVGRLRSLASLDLVSHLTAGPILRRFSTDFTHLLHARYLSKPDLAAYAVHPSHIAVVKANSAICDDIMAVDWVADLDVPIVPLPGSAMRFVLAKPREGIAAGEVIKRIEEIRASFAAAQVTYGENFSPARGKGYEVGFVLVLSGLGKLDEGEGKEGMEALMEKITPLVESTIVVDYEVPSSAL